jgi:hypothetical protein
VKLSSIASGPYLFGASSDNWAANYSTVLITSAGLLRVELASSSGNVITANTFRDYSAWMHVVVAVDTTQSTATNRVRIYTNGVEAAYSTQTMPTLNSDTMINSTNYHQISGRPSNNYFDGYLADVHFCDGYAYDPSYFTETDAITGQLIPKAFTGSYGTNGFRLTFSDNSGTTATTLGKDAAGSSNNWTPNNFSVASGAGNDSLVDSPTGYGTDTGAGNEVRGNYCTWNPLSKGSDSTLSNGNLDISAAGSGSSRTWGTIGVGSGKWYFEFTQTSGTYAQAVGIKSTFAADTLNNYFYWGFNGNKVDASGTDTSYGATWTNNDVIGVAFDLDGGTITFYKNGTSQGQAFSGITAATYFPYVNGYSGGSWAGNVNFGQRPFAYTAPSGYKALCSHNLPEPTILQGNTAMDVALYTGTGSSRSITGLAFSPDLVWIKARSVAYGHRLLDIVRGATNALASSSTAAEFVESNGVTAFNATGFSLGSDVVYNENASTFVAWCWDCGSSTVTNTSGSISSQVRASATNGCSVVTYTGTGSNATVGHGLGAAPAFIITKSRNNAFDWTVYHQSLGISQYLFLNSTAAVTGSTNYWNTAPTSTIFGVGNNNTGSSGSNLVAYCFAPVAGFSAFGSYTGNGSSDGPFVYTGFRPRWILIKVYSGDTGNWWMYDAARNTYNLSDSILHANLSLAEFTSNGLDILSNGFKIRTSNANTNGSGFGFVYAAFAESPVKYSRAR